MDDEKARLIKTLYEQRPEFSDFFKVLSSKQRSRSFTELDTFVNLSGTENLGNLYVRKRLATEFFRELERIGIGQFKIGRRGKPTRFIWRIPLRDVADVLQGTEGFPRMDEQASISKEFSLDESPRIFNHKYPLRENFVVMVDLPRDLSSGEADKLSAWIKTLSTNGGN